MAMKTRSSATAETPERDIGSYTPLAFNAVDGGVHWEDLDLRKRLYGGQRMGTVQNGETNIAESFNPRVGHTNVTNDRQTTDGFTIANTRT